jgi:hypothetical protein
MNTTVGGKQEASNDTSGNITVNNSSDNVLGSLFLIGEDTLTSFNRINETYTKLSYAGNRTIIPPETISTAKINATEIGYIVKLSI